MSTRSGLGASDGTHGLTACDDGSLDAARAPSFDIEPVAPGVVAIRDPVSGQYLSALDEGTCAARGLPRYSATFSAAHIDIWEHWKPIAHGRGIALQSYWGTWLSVQEGGAAKGEGRVLVDGPTPGPWEELLPSNPAAFGIKGDGGNSGQGGGGSVSSGPDALVGLVSIHGRSFGDATGPRIVHGYSDFGALKKFHEDRDRMLGQLDRAAQAGQQYVRVLWRLNGGYWTDSGVTNDPIRDPWWEDALRGFLQACHDRGLRANLTSGDFYNWSDQEADDSFRRCAQIAASVSNEVVWLGAAANELRGVHPEGEGDAAVAQCEALQEIWAREYPGSLRSVSDPADQACGGMQRLSGGNSNVALIHDVRWEVTDALRRCFNTVYENDPGKPVVQDEPTGPNGHPPDGTPYANLVYQPVEDPNELFAIYTMQVITGQASTYFNDPALASRQPIDSTWGFTELPALWRQMAIPQDIGQGDLKPGHHDDAPLQVVYSNAERADCAVRGTYAVGVISGGDNWRVKSGWDGTLTLFGASGATHEQRIARGQEIPAHGPAPQVVRIVR